MSKYRYWVMAVFSCLAMSFQCGEEYVEPEYNHILQESLRLTPYKKTYDVGDTLWVATNNIPGKYLYDAKVYKRVLVDSVSLPLRLGFNRLYKGMSGSVTDFVDVIYYDQVERAGEYLNFYYGCNQPDYNFRVGFVLRVPGIYSLTVHDQNIFSNCITSSQNSYSQIFYKFDVEDSNKDVFLSIPAISRGGLTTEKMDAKEEFIVQVQ